MYNLGYSGYGDFGHMFSLGIIGMLLMVFVWILIIGLIISVIRRIVWGSRWQNHDKWRHWQGMGNNSGMNILNERYAKGEINKEEYEQKKKDILD
jgi:putative membrane protein